MKNTFAKKVLLIGAVAVGLSAVVPAHAMDRNELKSQVSTSSLKESEGMLKRHMHTLDVQWKQFVKCVKGDKSCTTLQVAMARTLSAIMIIVGAMALKKAGSRLASTEHGKSATSYVAKSRAGQAVSGKYAAGKEYVTTSLPYIAASGAYEIGAQKAAAVRKSASQRFESIPAVKTFRENQAIKREQARLARVKAEKNAAAERTMKQNREMVGTVVR